MPIADDVLSAWFHKLSLTDDGDSPAEGPGYTSFCADLHRLFAMLNHDSMRELALQEPKKLWKVVVDNATRGYEIEIGRLRGAEEARDRNQTEMNAALRAENEALKADNAALKGENASVKAENAALKPEIVRLQAETVALKAENAALKPQIVRLQAETVALKVENAALNAENAALKAQIVRLQAETVDLKADIDRVKTDFAEKKARRKEKEQRLEQEKEKLVKEKDVLTSCNRHYITRMENMERELNAHQATRSATRAGRWLALKQNKGFQIDDLPLKDLDELSRAETVLVNTLLNIDFPTEISMYNPIVLVTISAPRSRRSDTAATWSRCHHSIPRVHVCGSHPLDPRRSPCAARVWGPSLPVGCRYGRADATSRKAAAHRGFKIPDAMRDDLAADDNAPVSDFCKGRKSKGRRRTQERFVNRSNRAVSIPEVMAVKRLVQNAYPLVLAPRGRSFNPVTDSTTGVSDEINMLLKIDKLGAPTTLPIILNHTADFKELGTIPVGKPGSHDLKSSAVRQVLHDVLDALVWLHSHNIVHRDVRWDNIVGVENAGRPIKGILIDLGEAVDISDRRRAHYFRGGYTCCPLRLMQGTVETEGPYHPVPAYDYAAWLLLVNSLMYPKPWMTALRASGKVLCKNSTEQRKMIRFWEELMVIDGWDRFYRAAVEESVDGLRRLTGFVH
ncbi:hypothetical protein FN846DRAFT_888565 [Sphaerosporella brunnea]|uniref:Fungal-type protein kinase domain-containing protein n=1 Tax=Sphaerosporella brunnea TaxID=1250544 RepID=A0A5J5F2Z5_9PEZI|nr:hypothetical protein FN846DRAFT_888565 [Sphaerosporella brunnea]